MLIGADGAGELWLGALDGVRVLLVPRDRAGAVELHAAEVALGHGVLALGVATRLLLLGLGALLLLVFCKVRHELVAYGSSQDTVGYADFG